jgi:DNA processing protein
MTHPDSWKGLRHYLAKESLVDVLRLIRSENVGPVTFFNLVRQFGAAKNALEAIPELAAKGGRRAPVLCYTVKDAEEEIGRVEKLGARMIRYGEEAYPELLMSIYDPPPLLTVLGHAHVWKNKTTLAIVGSRNASANSYQLTKKLASDAGTKGYIVVSGLARGIDTAAHLGSLAAGTVAVMANGIDQVYPPENKSLYDSIAQQGAIITEQAFGMAPHSRSFPGRNRIISGMSRGTVVVEASLKSGSLITARFALEQDREVFAVPGSPMDPRCKGPNGLIKQGAMVCESIEDIVQAFSHMPTLFAGEQKSDEYMSAKPAALNAGEIAEARKLVHSKLGYHAVQIDQLLTQCQLTANLLSLVLLELELAGRLQRHPGHKVSLKTEDLLAEA